MNYKVEAETENSPEIEDLTEGKLPSNLSMRKVTGRLMSQDKKNRNSFPLISFKPQKILLFIIRASICQFEFESNSCALSPPSIGVSQSLRSPDWPLQLNAWPKRLRLEKNNKII